MQNLIFILVLLLIGKCLSYAKDFPEDTFKAFASYIIYVSLPALILVQVPRLELSADVLAPSGLSQRRRCRPAHLMTGVRAGTTNRAVSTLQDAIAGEQQASFS